MAAVSKGKDVWYKDLKFYLFGLLSIAVLLRAIFIYQISISDFSDFTSLDSKYYVQLAEGMLMGRPLATTVLTFNPLYPLFLFIVYIVWNEFRRRKSDSGNFRDFKYIADL